MEHDVGMSFVHEERLNLVVLVSQKEMRLKHQTRLHNSDTWRYALLTNLC
jgi:hypothetical protein